MGGVMQSGVSTAQQTPPLPVCPRLCTGTHSSDRKVRTNSVQLLHYPSIHSCPSFHPFILFNGLHPPCFPFSGTQPHTVLWHPPTSLPTSPPTFSCAPSFCTCTVSWLFNHIFPPSVLLSASETAWLPLLLNSQIYVCLKTCTAPVDLCWQIFFPPLFIIASLISHFPFKQNCLNEGAGWLLRIVLHSSDGFRFSF